MRKSRVSAFRRKTSRRYPPSTRVDSAVPRTGHTDVHRVVVHVRQPEITGEQPAVRVRIRAHAQLARRQPVDDLGPRTALVVEQLVDTVGTHPRFELREMLRLLPHLRQRNLMRAPGSLDGQAVDHLRTGPPLRRAQHDHRPAGTAVLAAGTRATLYRADLAEHVVERRGQFLMHARRIVTGDEVRLPAVAGEEVVELGLGDACEHGRVRDLVTVEVQDREHRAVADRIEELVRVPARGERTRLRLAVTDDARDDQIGVVERGAERVTDRVAELATFVNRARRLRCDVARYATRKRELAEQSLHAFAVARDRRVRSRCSCPRATCSQESRARRDRDRSHRSCRCRRERSRDSRCAYSRFSPGLVPQ